MSFIRIFFGFILCGSGGHFSLLVRRPTKVWVGFFLRPTVKERFFLGKRKIFVSCVPEHNLFVLGYIYRIFLLLMSGSSRFRCLKFQMRNLIALNQLKIIIYLIPPNTNEKT